MPVPSSIAYLSTSAGSNSPAGTEAPSTLDNYQRAHASFIAQLRAVIGGATDANIPTSWATDSDLSGAVIGQALNSGTTAGTSTAYTLAPAAALVSYAANSTFWVRFHTASGVSPTLQISGLATPPNLVRQNETGAYANIEAGDIPANHCSRVTLLSASQALVEDMPNSALNTSRIDIASAATVNLSTGAPNTRHINITGTTSITAFTVAAGQCYFVRFGAALTLTNNANIVTQSGANITTSDGDTCILRATAANVVEIISYTPFKNQAVGYAQTWQNVSGSRTSGTTYTNSTGKPIQVMIATVNGASSTLTVAGQLFSFGGGSSGATALQSVCAVIPNGATYVAAYTTLSSWLELR